MFCIDEEKYRVIDISFQVVPGQGGDRPFEMRPGILADGALKYDITNTHTHVGSHVESAAHFFEDGTPIDKYPLAAFYGPGVLLEVDPDQDGPVPAAEVAQRFADHSFRLPWRLSAAMFCHAPGIGYRRLRPLHHQQRAL